jgi:hypothetical protein
MVVEIKVTGVTLDVDYNREFAKKVGGFIEDFLDKVLMYALENLEKNESWVTGHLAKSGRVEISKAMMYIEGELLFGAPYAAYVEFGTRPHAAPLGPSLPEDQSSTPDLTTNPLDYWSWKKGETDIIPCWLGNKFYGFHTSLGWGVWKKILGRGSDPHPYLRPALDKAKIVIPELVKKHQIEVKKK